ncbi:unnamed protein product [Haemonchus placei]|uniref:C3H1-type domain-containing protein n=1 Tax=Haemonchus placei TaxID=6290 RepID=A0A0N4VSE1_HAEPC|nr:unnamed protein product [Haemonchus placei]
MREIKSQWKDNIKGAVVNGLNGLIFTISGITSVLGGALSCSNMQTIRLTSLYFRRLLQEIQSSSIGIRCKVISESFQHGYCPRAVFCAFAHHDSELHVQRTPYVTSTQASPKEQSSPNTNGGDSMRFGSPISNGTSAPSYSVCHCALILNLFCFYQKIYEHVTGWLWEVWLMSYLPKKQMHRRAANVPCGSIELRPWKKLTQRLVIYA